ncbi:MAG: hypothetical protein NEHIOOID_00255 [Holosporales bacterium]
MNKRLKRKTVFLLGLLLSPLESSYTDPKQVLTVNGKKLSENAVSYLLQSTGYTQSLYNVSLGADVTDRLIISQVDTVSLDKNIVLTKDVSIVGGKGGSGGNSICSSGGGGGGGATFGHRTGVALGGQGTSGLKNALTIGAGGESLPDGANGGNGGNGAGGGGGAAAIGNIQSCGGGQGGGNLIGGGGGGSAATGLTQSFIFAGTSGGFQGNIKAATAYNGEKGIKGQSYFGGSGFGQTNFKTYCAGGGAAKIQVSEVGTDFSVNINPGAPGYIIKDATNDIPHEAVVGGQGGGGKGSRTFNNIMVTQMGSGGVGGGGGAAGGSSPGQAGQSSIRVGSTNYSGGTGGSANQDFVPDHTGQGVDAVSFGSGGSGFGIAGLALAGGGSGGGFGVGGGAAGFGFDRAARVSSCALAGGGGGGFGSSGGQGWSSSSLASGSGGSGGKISIENENLPSDIAQECRYGLSGGDGGNGYGGGDGGDAGGTLTIGMNKILTVADGGSLSIYGGLAGADGFGKNPGKAGAGGGILNIGDPIDGNGTCLIDVGGSLNLYAPNNLFGSSSPNGGGLNIFAQSVLKLEGTLNLFGYVQTTNKGSIVFGDYSVVKIDINNFSFYKDGLFKVDIPKKIITVHAVNDNETGVGSIPAQTWVIQANDKDSKTGQTAHYLQFNPAIKNVFVDSGSFLFSTGSSSFRLDLDKTLTLTIGSSFVIQAQTIIYGKMVVDKNAKINDLTKELYIYGTLSSNAADFDSYSMSWLQSGSTFVTTENFSAKDVFLNKDFTWHIFGKNNTALSLPQSVGIEPLCTLDYLGYVDQRVNLSGQGYFNHRGTANLTVTGITPFIKSYGPLTIMTDLSGQKIEMNGAPLKIIGQGDTEKSSIQIQNEILQNDGELALSGNVSFGSTVTLMNEAHFSIEKGANVTLGDQSHLKIVNGSDFVDVTVTGGKIGLGQGGYSFNNTHVSNVEQSYGCFKMTGQNTFDSYTMGIASQADDTNALLMMPGSSLAVSGPLILNNKTVLIIGYDGTQAVGSKIDLISGNPSNKYDYIFALRTDKGESTGILSPMDATVDIGGTHYRFDVIENESGVVLQMIQNDSINVGSNTDLVVHDILTKNSYLKAFLKYDAYKSSYSYRLSLINGGIVDLPDETLELGPTEGLGSDPSPDFYVSKDEEIPTHAFLKNADGTETVFRVDQYGNIIDHDGNIIDDFYNIHGQAILKAGSYHFPFGLLVDVGDELIFKPGSISSGKTIKMQNGRINIEGDDQGNKVIIENDLNMTGGEFNVSGYVKLGGNTNIEKEVTTQIANATLEQDESSVFTVVGDHRFSDVNILGGHITLRQGIYDLENVHFKSVVTQDPALFKMTGQNTFDSYTMGIAGQADDTNALLMMPGSSLAVSGPLILNNKTVLIIGYDPKNIENIAKQPLTFSSVISAVSHDTFFDQVLLLNIIDGQSGGLLYPADATVNIDDIHYGFNISYADHGISVTVLQGVEPSAGRDIDSVIDDLLSVNAALREYVKYNVQASSFTAREVQVEEAGNNGLSNALISAVNMMNGTKGSNKIIASDFRRKGFSGNQRTKDRLENIIKNIENDGPIILKNDAGKAWICPYTRYSNTKGTSSSTQWIAGLLFGIEYNLKQLPATIGFLGGGYLSGQKQKNIRQTFEDIEGMNVGLYGSYGIWQGGRIDYMYTHSLSTIDRNDTYGLRRINHRYKTNDDVFDAQISHLVKWDQNVWSVRFNMGYTYQKMNAHLNAVDMARLPLNSRRKSSSKEGEVYAGIGLRWNKKTQTYRLRLTGVYEYGISTHRSEKYLTYKTSGVVASSAALPKNRTHYLTCYGALDINDRWKFVGGMQSSLTKNVVDLGGFVKIVYRF